MPVVLYFVCWKCHATHRRPVSHRRDEDGGLRVDCSEEDALPDGWGWAGDRVGGDLFQCGKCVTADAEAESESLRRQLAEALAEAARWRRLAQTAGRPDPDDPPAPGGINASADHS